MQCFSDSKVKKKNLVTQYMELQILYPTLGIHCTLELKNSKKTWVETFKNLQHFDTQHSANFKKTKHSFPPPEHMLIFSEKYFIWENSVLTAMFATSESQCGWNGKSCCVGQAEMIKWGW